MQDERVVAGNGDRFGEVAQVLLHIDQASRVVTKDKESMIEPYIDRRRLHCSVVDRVDSDGACFEVLTDGSVAQDHVEKLADPRNGGPMAALKEFLPIVNKW